MVVVGFSRSCKGSIRVPLRPVALPLRLVKGSLYFLFVVCTYDPIR